MLIGLAAAANCPSPLPNRIVMLRLFPHATRRSGFLSLLTSPVITLPGPAGTAIGEPAAGVNDDCCASTLLAFPDWHEAKSIVATRSNIERLSIPFDAQQISFLSGGI